MRAGDIDTGIGGDQVLLGRANIGPPLEQLRGNPGGDVRQRQFIDGLAGPLADTQIPISGIALELAYSDAIAFGQAFKKWFGKMPSESRNQLTRQPPGWDGTTRAPGR